MKEHAKQYLQCQTGGWTVKIGLICDIHRLLGFFGHFSIPLNLAVSRDLQTPDQVYYYDKMEAAVVTELCGLLLGQSLLLWCEQELLCILIKRSIPLNQWQGHAPQIPSSSAQLFERLSLVLPFGGAVESRR